MCRSCEPVTKWDTCGREEHDGNTGEEEKEKEKEAHGLVPWGCKEQNLVLLLDTRK